MISLKEAIKLSPTDIEGLKSDIIDKAKVSKLGAYIGFESCGSGVPILVKDNINVKGWPVTCASRILEGYISPYNATVINKLSSNGFSFLGRSNMDEFAMGSSTESSCYGPTKNPYDLDKVPGGSSGGSAAAVAAGIAVAALGSDTGGSIRQPAALCGIVGMKPTYGRVSRYGLVAYGSSLDQIGPFARSVEDAAILYDAMAGYDDKDSTSAKQEHKGVTPNLNASRKLRVAVIENFVEQAAPAVRDAISCVVEQMEKDGHEVKRVQMMNSKYDIAAYYITATAEAATNLQRYDGVRYGRRVEGVNLQDMYIKTRSEGFGAEVKRRILLGNFVLSSGYYDAYYVKAQKTRELITREYAEIFQNADIIVLPVTPSTAFGFASFKEPLEMYLEDIYTIGVNLSGLPGISVPVGLDEGGLPIGMQLLAKHFDEQTLFDAALTVEKIASYNGKPKHA